MCESEHLCFLDLWGLFFFFPKSFHVCVPAAPNTVSNNQELRTIARPARGFAQTALEFTGKHNDTADSGGLVVVDLCLLRWKTCTKPVRRCLLPAGSG